MFIYVVDATSGAAEDSPSIIAPNENPGNKRHVLQFNFDLEGGAGGDLYYRSAAAVLTALAKGTIGQTLKMNTAETAPEWTGESFYGVTWDESGDVYTRTGSTLGLSTSSSLPDDMLPIHANMRRCILSVGGVVQYYLRDALEVSFNAKLT